MKGQRGFDEFALVLLAGVILIALLMIVWTTPLEPSPIVSPKSVSLTLQNGTTGIFLINITGTVSNVTLSARGIIAAWISFEKNGFDVFESTIVTVFVKVPSATLPGTYEGTVVVKSLGGEDSVRVTVEVSITKRLTSRAIPLGDFTVSFAEGTQAVTGVADAVVSKSYFSEKPLQLTGNIEPQKLALAKDASLQLLVTDTNSFGNLVILLNGVQIFNQRVGKGELTIPIGVEKLQIFNTLQIRATDPGFYFWANTVYILKNIKLSYSFEGGVSKEIPFALTDNEVNNFDHFQLTWAVVDYSLPLRILSIEINGQTVYSEQPPLAFFNREFNLDIFGTELRLRRNNTIGFSFTIPSSLSVSNAVLSVFFRTVQ